MVSAIVGVVIEQYGDESAEWTILGLEHRNAALFCFVRIAFWITDPSST